MDYASVFEALPEPWKWFISDDTQAQRVVVETITEASRGLPWAVFSPDDIPEQVARDAFTGVSHSPERRAESARVRDYAIELNNRVRRGLAWLGSDQERADYLEVIRERKPGISRAYTSWLDAKGRTTSWFITGPSGRNERREQKKHDTADRRYQEYAEKVEKAFKAAKKTARDRADARRVDAAGGPIAVQAGKVQQLEERRELIKKANRIVRGKPKNERTEAKVERLRALGFSHKVIDDLFTPNYMGNVGFESYILNNLGAQIRTAKQRLADMEAREALKEATRGRDLIWEFGEDTSMFQIGGTVEYSPGDDRIRIAFRDRIPREDYQKMRRLGWKYSRNHGAFSRHLRNSGVYSAREVSGLGKTLPLVEVSTQETRRVAERQERGARVEEQHQHDVKLDASRREEAARKKAQMEEYKRTGAWIDSFDYRHVLRKPQRKQLKQTLNSLMLPLSDAWDVYETAAMIRADRGGSWKDAFDKAASRKLREKTHKMNVGDTVTLIGAQGLPDERVILRGFIGDEATVMLNGIQMTVPRHRIAPLKEP